MLHKNWFLDKLVFLVSPLLSRLESGQWLGIDLICFIQFSFRYASISSISTAEWSLGGLCIDLYVCHGWFVFQPDVCMCVCVWFGSIFFLTMSFPRAKHVWFENSPSPVRVQESRSKLMQASQNILSLLNKVAENHMAQPAQGTEKSEKTRNGGRRGRFSRRRCGRRGRDGWNQLYYKFKPIIRL